MSNTSTSIAQAKEKRNQPIGCVSNVTETTDYRLEIQCIVNLIFSYSEDKKLVYFPGSKFKTCVVKTQKPIIFLLASLKIVALVSCNQMKYFLPFKILKKSEGGILEPCSQKLRTTEQSYEYTKQTIRFLPANNAVIVNKLS